jgi:hypothetical protein
VGVTFFDKNSHDNMTKNVVRPGATGLTDYLRLPCLQRGKCSTVNVAK